MLFDENNFYNFLDFDNSETTMNYFNMQKEYNPKVLDPEKGFIYGNMFPDLYKPYKNLKPGISKPKNERESWLLKIQSLDFAVNDLNLYLDMHCTDQEMYLKFKKMTEELKMIVKEYEKQYGPLMLDHSPYESYMWDKNPWPWNKEGSF